MNFELWQSNDLPESNANPLSEEQIQQKFPNPELQAELNRFKEIQKNPQLLLRKLFEMENQKQREVEQTISEMDQILSTDTEEDETMDIVQTNWRRQLCLCHICGSVLQKSSLWAHLKGHSGYMCDIHNCSSVFTSRRKLKNHQRAHRAHDLQSNRSIRKNNELTDKSKNKSDTKSNVCKVCNQPFPHKCSLAQHLTMHTGTRNRTSRYQIGALRSRIRRRFLAATFPGRLRTDD